MTHILRHVDWGKYLHLMHFIGGNANFGGKMKKQVIDLWSSIFFYIFFRRPSGRFSFSFFNKIFRWCREELGASMGEPSVARYVHFPGIF